MKKKIVSVLLVAAMAVSNVYRLWKQERQQKNLTANLARRH